MLAKHTHTEVSEGPTPATCDTPTLALYAISQLFLVVGAWLRCLKNRRIGSAEITTRNRRKRERRHGMLAWLKHSMQMTKAGLLVFQQDFDVGCKDLGELALEELVQRRRFALFVAEPRLGVGVVVEPLGTAVT